MNKETPVKPDPARPLPERANLEHLKKEAKQRLKAMRLDNPGATLSAVQLIIAREYGFSSWRSLVAYVKSQADKESQPGDQRQTARARPFVVQALLDGLEAVGKFDVPSETPKDPNLERPATLIDDQPEALKPVTILYNPFKEMAKYTEIARINRLKGTIVLSAFFGAQGWLSDIRVARGLPDGLTRRAIEALKLVRVSPASLNEAPVGMRESIEFDFKLD